MEKMGITSIVLGTFFGDEGKGLTTSFLAKDKNAIVIRFNGGHQAGHTVIKDNLRHVFASFGAGTLNGAHTYWSEYCTFYPVGYMNEWNALKEKGINPTFYIHPLAPITTPYDVAYNRLEESSRFEGTHGSVGVGFGATIERHENSPYKLYAKDLQYRELFIEKVKAIQSYYIKKGVRVKIEEHEKFMTAAIDLINTNFGITPLDEIMYKYSDFVFEGAQGIMLDQSFGFFPHVTRSNTTSKNAMEIINKCGLPLPQIYYTMRSYLTRHGNGPMPGEAPLLLDNNEHETNTPNNWQGVLRTGYHSYRMIAYALDCDNLYSRGLKKSIVISCLDQTKFKVMLEEKAVPLEEFEHTLLFHGIDFLYSDKGEKIVKYAYELSKLNVTH